MKKKKTWRSVAEKRLKDMDEFSKRTAVNGMSSMNDCMKILFPQSDLITFIKKEGGYPISEDEQAELDATAAFSDALRRSWK